jgi:hypothetical protein
MLSVQATDLGGGTWHYEYALLNKDSDREIRSSARVQGAADGSLLLLRGLGTSGGARVRGSGTKRSDYDVVDEHRGNEDEEVGFQSRQSGGMAHYPPMWRWGSTLTA